MAVHVGNKGVKITLSLRDENGALNISSAAGATDKQIRFLRPDGSKFQANASFTTDGTDGKLYVVSDITFFTVSGLYKCQAFLKLSTGFEGIIGDEREFEFEVKANFT